MEYRTKTYIVCPTPAGGHIEHAADLAVAIFHRTGERPCILTRKGSAEYLPTPSKDYFDIHEVIPELPKGKGLVRHALQALSLVLEHWHVWRTLPARKRAILVVEEPRYPWPRLFSIARRNLSTVLIMHNATRHEVSKSLSSGIQDLIADLAVKGHDRIVVHGTRQRDKLSKLTSRPIVPVALPRRSRVLTMDEQTSGPGLLPNSMQDYFLCLGEIRENKGIETAITAAARASVNLVVAGRAINDAYLAQIKAEAQTVSGVYVLDRFLSVSEFSSILASCKCVVLPYTHFEAQSGILAKAMDLDLPVIAADLPSLVEQAGTYGQIMYFAPSDAASLASLMMRRDGMEPLIPSDTLDTHDGMHEWDAVALAVLESS